MGLSTLPDAPNTGTAASAGAATAAKGGGGAAGAGGAAGGGLALKLTCSLAILAFGLSDAASSQDAERRVRVIGLSGAILRPPPVPVVRRGTLDVYLWQYWFVT